MVKRKIVNGVKSIEATMRWFSANEQGATAIEYGLIVSLIFLAIVGSVRAYSNSTSETFSEISSSIN